jgi:CHAT domain-containing protein/tetratricopeptide (TPR) repeat protein
MFVFTLWALLGLISTLFFLNMNVLPGVTGAPLVNPIVQTLSDPDQQEQQGKAFYEAGQFSEAATVWQQAASAFEAQGNTLDQAMVLSNLALAYQQLGLWPQAIAAITESLNLIQTQQNKSDSPHRLNILAQALDTQGSLHLALGQSEQALTAWEQAASTYAQAGDDAGVTRSLINLAQALKALGFYRRALTTLTQVNQSLQKQPDSLIKAAGLRSLGNILRLVGDLDQSQQVLQQSLTIAQKLKSPQDIGDALFNLGNTARVQQDTKAALAFYQQAAMGDKPPPGANATGSRESGGGINPPPSRSPTTKIQAQLNQLSLLIETGQELAAQALWPQIQSQIVNLPPSRTAVYARINFAQSLMKLRITPSSIAQLLATTVHQAKSLKDSRAEAYALGSLGGLYEQTQQWSSAQDLTQQALLNVQAINAPEIAYRSSWQLGRLLKVQGDLRGAIAAYSQAVNTLQSLRSDLVAINPDIEFSFRESVEPVYRELVSLLLQPGNTATSQQNLVQARQVIESLQLAELDNFLREACDRKSAQIDRVDPHTAVIYPIILADRLEVILTLPQQRLRHYATSLSQSEVESILENLRQNLIVRTSREFMPFSQQVYNWLIRPAETDLANSGVNTLVFVLDGALRNIPMAVLHNGNQYLVEKYNIALAPSLALLDPKPLQREDLEVLSAGLTEARLGFAPLENVALELNEIKSKVPSVVLLNQEFTRENFQAKIESASFPIVHIATHGKFSSKAAETFILTWDDRLSVNQLDNLLRSRAQNGQRAIELLVLSACETATGDKRAALGLAGIAVRAGARSTLATLWAVNDAASADLISQFYHELTNTKDTKAEALRRAQLSLLQTRQYKHPIYWAPYVLLGNWL